LLSDFGALGLTYDSHPPRPGDTITKTYISGQIPERGMR
jgi:hypothetical protein